MRVYRSCRSERWRAIAVSLMLVGASSIAVSASLAQSSADAQPVNGDATVLPPTTAEAAFPRFGLWAEGTTSRAPVSNGSSLRDRAIALVGIEREHRLGGGTWGDVTTSPSLLPAVYTSGNRRAESFGCGGVLLLLCTRSIPYSAFGIGIMPLSIRVQTTAERRVSLVLRADAGGVYFTHRIPAETGTRLNFIAQGGADVALHLTRRSWALVGYRHVHLSNGGLGTANPGIDAPLLTLGFAWR